MHFAYVFQEYIDCESREIHWQAVVQEISVFNKSVTFRPHLVQRAASQLWSPASQPGEPPSTPARQPASQESQPASQPASLKHNCNGQSVTFRPHLVQRAASPLWSSASQPGEPPSMPASPRQPANQESQPASQPASLIHGCNGQSVTFRSHLAQTESTPKNLPCQLACKVGSHFRRIFEMQPASQPASQQAS